MRNLSQANLRQIPLPLPPEGEVVRLAEGLDRQLAVAESSRDTLCADLTRIARLRQSILKWAFEGRLVDQDPTDEPAAELLARIRGQRAAVATKPKWSERAVRQKRA